MNDLTDEDIHQDWSRDTQKIAVLTWISFLTASAFTMLFFAFIDPLVIVDAINVEAIESRNAPATRSASFSFGPTAGSRAGSP